MPPPRPRGFASNAGGGLTPMSERQQMALLMQMTSSAASPSSSSNAEMSPVSAFHAPARSRDRNERGETALHVAAIKGDQDAVKKLLDSGMSPNVADFAGWTPLHEACNHAHYNVALTLVKAGANINAKGIDDDTPLHDAATIGHLKLVKMLVDKGAEANFKNRKGKSPLDVAHVTVVPYLQSIKDSSASNKISQTKKPYSSELKKNIEESDESTTNSSAAGQSISSSKEDDDIYEFKSTPKDSSGSGGEDKTDTKKNEHRNVSEDKNSEEVQSNTTNMSNNNSSSNPTSSLSSCNITGTSKRSYSDVEGNDDGCPDTEDNKRKKRNNLENVKDTTKHTTSGRGAPQRQEKTSKQLGGLNKQTISGTPGKINPSSDRKSPCASPSKTNDSDIEADDAKSTESFGIGGPKVPPLKIVIPQQNASGDSENSSRNGKNNSARNHAALPYVVASSSNSNDSVAADRESTSSRCASPADSTGKVSSSNLTCISEEKIAKATSEERAQQRVLRSSHRSGGQSVDRGSNNSSPQLQSSSPSPAPASNIEVGENISGKNTTINNASPATQGINQSENETSGNAPSPSASSTSSSKETISNIVELHPRKRKIRAKQEEATNKATSSTVANQASTNESSSNVSEVHPHDHPFTNCYQMYLNIRKQIEKKHKTLMPIQPRPPQGFKDYLLNRRTYVLAGNTPTEPKVVYPKNLNVQMEELFLTQEKERYKLKMRHLVEKEKLGLTVEQEILRVHAKAARSLACQSMPFSACTLLRDDEVYNLITPEQEEKDRNARSRYNGRLFLSWLQDVDDKWEKIKDSMLLRHHNEAESLHAVQKMDWEWVMKEYSLCDYKSQPVIDERHVPMVPVSDDFDLLPA